MYASKHNDRMGRRINSKRRIICIAADIITVNGDIIRWLKALLSFEQKMDLGGAQTCMNDDPL